MYQKNWMTGCLFLSISSTNHDEIKKFMLIIAGRREHVEMGMSLEKC
jgi:hypothetical protein